HMRRDSSGNIWIATYGEGVFKYNPARNKFTNIREGNGLCSDYIRYIYIDHSENIWVATEGGGICRFDGEKFTVFNQENGFSSPSASNMTEDNHGNLWIGTPGFGLYKFDGVNFQRFTTQDGLSGDFIYLTVSDEEGNIWIGTSRGVDKITPAPFHITHFGQEEGFLTVETNENAVLRDSKDKLWFGTIGGAILYNDKADVRNQVPPLLHITNLKLFLRETPIPPDHQFKYNQNHLTFEFIGISLSNPQKVRYQYQLEGFDETWSPITSERFATYSNIPPGDYIFKVKAANSDGIWTEQPVSFTFTIRPPFWQTWWFELLMFLGFVGLIYGISNYRIRSVAKRQKYLEEKVLERTQDLQAEKEKVEKAYQALQESEQKFREYTESSSSAIFIQQNNKFLYVNAALERLTGYRREELLGQDILRVVHPDMIDFVKEKIKQRKNGNRDYVRYELKIVRKDGEERWVDLTTCLIDYEGSWAVLGNAFDITERKLAEEALAEHEARLRTLIDSMPDFVCFKD
ncbi:MAG: PAS domain S-box protein, partial [Methanobacteriota archaeon]